MGPISIKLWALAREPFNIPPTVAARMSLAQIDLILTGEDSLILPERPPVDMADVHRRWAALNRVPAWYADKLWREAH